MQPDLLHQTQPAALHTQMRHLPRSHQHVQPFMLTCIKAFGYTGSLLKTGFANKRAVFECPPRGVRHTCPSNEDTALLNHRRV